MINFEWKLSISGSIICVGTTPSHFGWYHFWVRVESSDENATPVSVGGESVSFRNGSELSRSQNLSRAQPWLPLTMQPSHAFLALHGNKGLRKKNV